MAIGNSYPIKPTVENYDLFLGTRNGTNNTVNYTAQAVVNYLNTSASIAVGGQLTFQFLINEYESKSMFFPGGGGDNTPFSSITQLLISNADCSGNETNIFLEYLEGTDILISEQNHANIFGHYKITGYTVTATPGFYTLDLEYIGGNGNIQEDVYYNINSFILASNTNTPTLQQVTDAGNTTTTTVYLNGGALSDSINEQSSFSPGQISTVNINTGAGSSIDSAGVLSLSADGIGVGTIGTQYVTNIVDLQFPNKPAGSYTLATTSDIPSVTGFVPYTGATQDVDLGEFEIKAGQVEFDQTPTGTAGVGVMRWNDSDGTVDLGLKGGNVTLQVGQEQVLRVVNKTATNIDLLEANYQAVRVTGAQGQRLKVDLAQAINDTLSAETIGLVTETINNNQEGFITTSGLVRGINTTGSLQSETWADGDILYLSPTTAGNATKVKPVAPNHLIILGYVIRAHINQGSIFVKVDNGYELEELHNVKITTPENRDLLAYDSSDSIWKNSSFYNRSLGGVQYFNDFDSSVNFYNLVSLTGGTAAATQRLNNFVPNQTANQIGIAQYQTGTLATGWAMHITEQSANGQQFQFGGGNWMYESYIEVNTLSDATNRFRFVSGFGNVASSGTETNGAFFTYDEGGVSNGTIASPNWQCVTTVGAVRTLTTTSVAVTTTWTKLRIIVNADATEVKFYIDGTLVATHTTNIPVLPNRFKVKQAIVKSLGTGNRFVYCDYIFYENNLTTLR
jgi:hypothetical protein